jgi:glycogen operon protein
VTPDGVNFAVRSDHAAAIDLCLFDAEGESEIARIALPGRTGPVFHGHVRGLAAGARYGLRAHGPFDPAAGQRFNPAKLLLDPYALALDRPFRLAPSLFSYRAEDPWGGDSLDQADSAADMPKAIVTAPFDVAPPPRLGIPWGETVIYELHVRGFTRMHPDIPEALRGTFAGLAHPAAIDHLKHLGVTTVELMPAAAWIDERHLPPLGLGNYWGYNPVALMAPDPRLAPGGWAEVRAATAALAAAGIEAVLDVVFNHTGEGDALGPTVSLRGLDNAGAYRLQADDPTRYVNDAGTGNVLALDRPAMVRLAMDSLRAWRRLGGFSGFRFDLATILGRRAGGFDPDAPLLCAISQDPELRELKLIAEPWDIGPGGYQLGRFPAPWGEWNDRYRDTMRGLWRGEAISLGAVARRLAGSHDLLPGRRPSRGVNFVAAHDGFTLADLTAYAEKHNLANGEDNRDGSSHEASWNNGVEGPTGDPAILAARLADQRALLATLLTSRGTPMLPMGAEIGHSQGGNNNAYAQDNATGWLDWARADAGLLDFTRNLVAIRRGHPALRADRWLTGEALTGEIHPDVAWRRADGGALSAADWDDPHGPTLVMILAEPDGEELDRVALVFHRGAQPTDIVLPEPRGGFEWEVLADSADPARTGRVKAGAPRASPRSVLILAEAPATAHSIDGVDLESLGRLARAAGIASEWHTLEGERRLVSPDTQRALLAAMRLPASSRGEARDTLRRLADTHDRRTTPLTVLGREGHATEVRLGWPDGAPAPRTRLEVRGADGPLIGLAVDPWACPEARLAGRDGRGGRGLSVTLPPLPPGRYRLVREDSPDLEGRLTVAPSACYAPDALAGERRLFGFSAQIYSVRRRGDQGIGDFTTLGELGASAAREGAGLLAVNPMHALFADRRERASPYYPSDRRFLDPIYLDLTRIASADPGPVVAEQRTVDYPAVWALKCAALEAAFRAAPEDPALEAFIAAGGEALARFATFQAITETLPGISWRDWPAGLRSPVGPDVTSFRAAHAGRVRFHQYLQWLCERQLAEAARTAEGLALGLGRDLAIGAAPDGAEAWANAELLAQGVSVGAPPDPLGPQGQVWGLPPLDPLRSREDGHRLLAGLFAANMRHAGALRIDHVMGLARLFWVPEGAPGSHGAYVAYPLHELLGELALESHRARCLVIGEDLGSVPHGLRETLAEAKVLSYQVLAFEQEGPGRFKPPAAYPRLAFACAATHDLPTLAGWWAGLDIDERLALGLWTEAEAQRAMADRRIDKTGLIDALTQAGLSAAGLHLDGPLTPEAAGAVHTFIAATPSALAVAQVEDLAGEKVAVNLPGTDQERPNWRRRIGAPLETLMQGETARAILEALRAARP